MREAYEALIRLANPTIPHITEELWKHLGHTTYLAETPWPEADESLAQEESITIAVQINGKVRAQITLPRDCDQQVAEEIALGDPNVQKEIADKDVRKIIFVPNRIVNVVV